MFKVNKIDLITFFQPSWESASGSVCLLWQTRQSKTEVVGCHGFKMMVRIQFTAEVVQGSEGKDSLMKGQKWDSIMGMSHVRGLDWENFQNFIILSVFTDGSNIIPCEIVVFFCLNVCCRARWTAVCLLKQIFLQDHRRAGHILSSLQMAVDQQSLPVCRHWLAAEMKSSGERYLWCSRRKFNT